MGEFQLPLPLQAYHSQFVSENGRTMNLSDWDGYFWAESLNVFFELYGSKPGIDGMGLLVLFTEHCDLFDKKMLQRVAADELAKLPEDLTPLEREVWHLWIKLLVTDRCKCLACSRLKGNS